MTDDRTWLASVLFTDIVGYTKVPVDQQMAIKLHFTSIISNHIDGLVSDECLKLDTGDGCAICYLGDPEQLYPVATSLLHTFKQIEASGEAISYQVRLGLNLGPVKLVNGIGASRNCVGAGINDAQRIMDFAQPNQLYIGRSYFDMVSNMSSNYANELVSAGSQVDKHNKIHELFELASLQLSAKQTVINSPGFDLDEEVKKHICCEFAKFVGSEQAQAKIQGALQNTSSVAGLCELLSSSLDDDDRYHFGEFTEYYGYSNG